MKVVHINWSLTYGGIETMLVNIANAQAATIQAQTTGLNEYVVQLELNKSGTKKFAKAMYLIKVY